MPVIACWSKLRDASTFRILCPATNDRLTRTLLHTYIRRSHQCQLCLSKNDDQGYPTGVGVAKLLHRAGIGLVQPKLGCNIDLPKFIGDGPALGEEALAC